MILVGLVLPRVESFRITNNVNLVNFSTFALQILEFEF